MIMRKYSSYSFFDMIPEISIFAVDSCREKDVGASQDDYFSVPDDKSFRILSKQP